MDPLNTSLLVRMARRAYRPFQQDAEWEWPFTKQTFKDIQKYFDIEDMQGTLGFSKWGYVAGQVPFTWGAAVKLGKVLHGWDLKHATKLGFGLWSCLGVVMCLRRKELPES